MFSRVILSTSVKRSGIGLGSAWLRVFGPTGTTYRQVSGGHYSGDIYKTGFMFPGQGAQKVGMAEQLCRDIPEARTLFDTASGILGYDLLEKCIQGPQEELDRTEIAQPALFVASMAALEKLKVEDPTAVDACSVALGLSLGEYSALCFADAFSFEDGVKLTKARGKAMQAASDQRPSGMVAIVGLDLDVVQRLCDTAEASTGQSIRIGNFLMERNYAVSGDQHACEVIQDLALEAGARTVLHLAVAGAFHSPVMQPAVSPLSAALEAVPISIPRIPVISNVDAKPYDSSAAVRRGLLEQLTRPVQWEQSVKQMLDAPEFQSAYEVGPGTVCKGIVKKYKRRASVVSVSC